MAKLAAVQSDTSVCKGSNKRPRDDGDGSGSDSSGRSDFEDDDYSPDDEGEGNDEDEDGEEDEDDHLPKHSAKKVKTSKGSNGKVPAKGKKPIKPSMAKAAPKKGKGKKGKKPIYRRDHSKPARGYTNWQMPRGYLLLYRRNFWGNNPNPTSKAAMIQHILATNALNFNDENRKAAANRLVIAERAALKLYLGADDARSYRERRAAARGNWDHVGSLAQYGTWSPATGSSLNATASNNAPQGSFVPPNSNNTPQSSFAPSTSNNAPQSSFVPPTSYLPSAPSSSQATGIPIDPYMLLGSTTAPTSSYSLSTQPGTGSFANRYMSAALNPDPTSSGNAQTPAPGAPSSDPSPLGYRMFGSETNPRPLSSANAPSGFDFSTYQPVVPNFMGYEMDDQLGGDPYPQFLPDWSTGAAPGNSEREHHNTGDARLPTPVTPGAGALLPPAATPGNTERGPSSHQSGRPFASRSAPTIVYHPPSTRSTRRESDTSGLLPRTTTSGSGGQQPQRTFQAPAGYQPPAPFQYPDDDDDDIVGYEQFQRNLLNPPGWAPASYHRSDGDDDKTKDHLPEDDEES